MFVDVFVQCVACLTAELDVFCRSFATQDNSAPFYSILMYQIKFPPPHLSYEIFHHSPSPLYEARKSKLIWICKICINADFFYFRPFLQVSSKNQFGILVLPDKSLCILVAETWRQWFSLSKFEYLLQFTLKNKICNCVTFCFYILSKRKLFSHEMSIFVQPV